MQPVLAKRAGGKKWLTGFLKNENCGLYDDRTNNYSKTGYLNKKAVHPGQAAAESGKENNYEFPWPVIRLAGTLSQLCRSMCGV